ncbi:hypothetical protein [[Limnothrix rosea] IAM M-220]|uniref:hypothetical protein n=1 Tax=[Limnothrix rosea] IAM M-220 TaxID=454133 RepID=UPI000962FF41|nr:hypothetical protein [[Limnothrix rosea] IAM M-220]OKH17162.1 hypothetical protein NIES208_10140 [[Limnothrix rosea] IAM M-220]
MLFLPFCLNPDSFDYQKKITCYIEVSLPFFPFLVCNIHGDYSLLDDMTNTNSLIKPVQEPKNNKR